MTDARDGAPESAFETPADQADPRFQEGLAHLQAGQWQAAIECFEALLREHPGSRRAQQALEDARFKAGIDARSRVRARQWIVPWRAIIFRVLVVVLIVLLAIVGYRLVDRQFRPAVAQAQEQLQQQQLLVEGNARLNAGELDEAEARFTELLARVPDHQEAQEGLAKIRTQRDLAALYERAVGLQEAGRFDEALVALTELSVRAPAYRDVNLRIAAIKKQQGLEELFAGAEADFQAGRAADAAAKYEQLRALNAAYQSDLVSSRLFDLYMSLGDQLVAGDRPRPEDLPAAREYFAKALALQPRSARALLEQSLVDLFLAAQSDYRAGNWERAATQFEDIYRQRPGYLGGQVIGLLYDSYIRNGDSFRDRDDCGFAYDQYRRAASLPVADRSLAIARQEAARPCLTPTPTPTETATPTLVPTPTPFILPTLVPTATPAPPLASFRNQIVFKANNEEKPGFWVMNPDGSNARYLGDTSALQKQYEALFEREKLSPDGRYRVYVQRSEGEDSPQLFIQGLERDQFGNLPTWQVTRFTGLNYDPAWSPDGSRIAYVSTHQGSDDIWVINPDGTNAWNYTRNKWEWDKHPSWSPDGQRIVFWSNREGTKQIFMIDANGQNLRKVRAVTWDEYDPIWIK